MIFLVLPLLFSAGKNKVKRVIFTSSASHVYGLVDKTRYPICEECELNPVNEYGWNKVRAEKAFEESNLQTIILRLSLVLGPYNNDPIILENMMPLLRDKRVILPGDGTNKNQCMHVNDVNTALIKAAETSNNSIGENEVFNISGEEVFTINDFIEISKNVCNSKSKIVHLPVPLAKGMVQIAWFLNKTKVHPSYFKLMTQDQYFDVSKAKKILGWKPIHQVEESLEDTIEFLKNEY